MLILYPLRPIFHVIGKNSLHVFFFLLVNNFLPPLAGTHNPQAMGTISGMRHISAPEAFRSPVRLQQCCTARSCIVRGAKNKCLLFFIFNNFLLHL